MKINKLLNLISVLLITTLLGNMLLLPGSAQAQTQAVPPAVASVVAGGERFMDTAPQSLGRALQLAQRLDYISQVELADLSETTLIEARQDALATAEQAATAQGSVGAIANGLTELDYQVQAAANMSTEVANLESNGFDAELETALADLGLTSGQIGALEDEAAANFNVRSSPLPAETVTLLQEAGLTQAEIDEIEATLTDYGLANNTLADRLAQFRASQEEMSLVRTQALVAYLQLLTKQVFVRQLAGETSRELTAAEVDEVVKDQLRLLIHLGYLDNLWNGNPDPNVGEGQWLFVERYSLRVAERLDTLILETQNLGLIVDLLVALQIHSTALAALAGDATYAKNEVDPLADFLETMLGDNLPGSQGYRHAAPPFWWGSALAMGDYNPAVLSDYEPEVAPEAVVVAQEQAQERIKGLAYPLWFQGGTDPDPDNNQAEMFFQTAPPLLPPGVLEILNQVMGGSTPLEFVWELLTGQSDNWWAIGGNIVLSFVPIFGSIVDMIGLFTEPTLLGKAFALIGLVASIISDAAQVLTACGIAVPPALAALPAAVGSEIVDIGAAVLKGALKLLTSDVMRVVREIPFNRALDLAGDLLGHLGRAAYQAADGNWPLDNLEAAVQLIRGVLNNVWDPFVALVKHFDGRLADLFALGFGDGAFLAGRVLKQGGEFNDVDKVIEGVAKVGDELGEAAADLSDEAVKALGGLVDGVGEEKVRRFLAAIPCGITQILDHRIVGLASPLRATLCTEAIEQLKNLSPEAHDGLQRLIKVTDESKVAQVFNDANVSNVAFFSTFGGVDEVLLKNMVSGVDGDLVRLQKYLVLMGDAGELNDLIRVANRGSNLGIAGIDELVKIVQDTPGVDFKRIKQLAIEGTEGSEIFKATQVREVKVGLVMEASPNGLRGPIKRPLNKNDFSHDFVDKSNQKWDIKSLHSGHNDYKTPKGLEKVLKDIQGQFDAGERVVIDVTDVTDEDAVNLFIAVSDKGWRNDRVKWYIPPERSTLLGLLY